MFKRLIEWTEGEVSRGRKLVLFSTVFVFLFITVCLFTFAMLGFVMADITKSLYFSFLGLIGTVYAFYTGTSSKKFTPKENK